MVIDQGLELENLPTLERQQILALRKSFTKLLVGFAKMYMVDNMTSAKFCIQEADNLLSHSFFMSKSNLTSEFNSL